MQFFADLWLSSISLLERFCFTVSLFTCRLIVRRDLLFRLSGFRVISRRSVIPPFLPGSFSALIPPFHDSVIP